MTNVGTVIERERKRRGISATAFAKRTGMTRMMLYRIETGQSDPTFSTLVAVGKVLNMQPGVLFEGIV